MAGGTGSADSLMFNDAYFTHPDDVRWVFDQLAKHFELEGCTALEPSAGACVFPKAAPQLRWTTNELYPEFSNGVIHDHHLDFAKDDLAQLGTFDFVIGNPPYGRNSTLARKFIKRALELAPVVAMVLPKGCRRHTVYDKDLPNDVRIVVDKPLPISTFELPDGRVKEVGTVLIVYSKEPGYSRGKLLEYESHGYREEERWTSKAELVAGAWPKWATHGICQWGAAGKMFDRSHRGYARAIWLQLTDEQAEKIASIDFTPLADRTKTSVPMLTRPEILTEINKALMTVG